MNISHRSLDTTRMAERSKTFRKRILILSAVCLILAAISDTRRVQAQSPSTTVDDYADVYQASLAIDHIRDLRYGSSTMQQTGSYSGRKVMDRLHSEDNNNDVPDYPVWNSLDLLEGNKSAFRLTVNRDFGGNKLNFSVFSDDEIMYVTFWGTTESNGAANIALPVINSSYDNAETHAGWAAVAVENYRPIVSQMAAQGLRSKRVIMTGHSQGGAVAGHLMCLLIKNKALNRSKRHRLITFGAPRYGTPSLRAKFNQYIRSNAPQTKAFDIEIREDSKITLWTDIINVGITSDLLYMGTRIDRPKSWCTKPKSDPHTHLNYVKLADRLFADAEKAPARAAKVAPTPPKPRPSATLSSIAAARSVTLCEKADRISVSSSPLAQRSKIKIVLTSSRSIRWWKGLKIYRNGKLVTELQTQDDKKSSNVTLDVNSRDQYHLEFGKGKAFGVHTYIKKHSTDFAAMSGNTVTFTWTKD